MMKQKLFNYYLPIILTVAVLVSGSLVYLTFNTNTTAKADTVVASAGTISSATKNSDERKIFFDGTYWWIFYMKSGTANTLFYSYSKDLKNWTETSVALGGTVTNDGGTITTYYDAGSHTVLVSYYTDTNHYRYMRGAISGTSITWSANTNFVNNNTKSASGDYAIAIYTDSSGFVWYASDNSFGNINVYQSTNTISSTFADSGASWTNNTTLDIANVNYFNKIFMARLAGGPVFLMGDDFSGATNFIRYGTAGSTVINGANVSLTNWGSVRVSDSDIRFLGVSNVNTFVFQSYNGTNWVDLTAPSWPTSGLATNSQVALATDGTNVWAFVIRGDANNTVSYNEYTGTTWSGWTDITSSAATRSYISVSENPGSGGIGVLWTQVNGGNFDIHVATIPNAVRIRGGTKVRGGSTSSVSFVQKAEITPFSSTPLNLVFGKNTSSGNTIIVWVEWSSATATMSVSDTQGNTYNLIASTLLHDSVNGYSTEMAYATNIKSAADTITVNTSTASFNTCAIAAEYSGIDNSNPLDQGSEGALVSSTTPTIGPVAPLFANELVVAGFFNFNGTGTTWTPGTGFSGRSQTTQRYYFEDKGFSGSGSVSGVANSTAGIATDANIATFRARPAVEFR